MRSLMRLGAGMAGVVALSMGCGSGSAGPAGQNGTNGTNGQNGAQGAQGPAGPAGQNGGTSASISAMIPRVGVLDREFDAVIVGNETAFDSTTKIDLGQGVTVSNLTVASPTALFLHVAVDKAAATGLHDLKVTGASAATVTGMFNVLPAMGVTVSAGTASQGALVQLDLTDNDTTGFAQNNGQSFFAIENGVYSFNNFLNGVIYQTPGASRLIVGLDPLAPAGNVQPLGLNEYLDQTTGAISPLTTFYSDPNAITVTARAPTPITIGTPLAGQTIATELADNLYQTTTDGTAQIAQVTFTTAGTTIRPFIWALPSSGKFADMLFPLSACCGSGSASTFNLPVGAIATDFFFVAHDTNFRGGQTGFDYSITSTKLAATAVTEVSTPHGTSATAQAVPGTTPTVLTGGITGTETDVYTFPNMAASTCPNFSITAQSDVCIVTAPSAQIDLAVSQSQQNAQCFNFSLGTGGAHGFGNGALFCTPAPGDVVAMAIYPRQQAQVTTGSYVFGFGY